MNRFLPLLGLALLAWLPSPSRAADPKPEPFDFKDGDRVVFVGNTLIEREQRYGYWEAALTARWPDKNIVFRNLGWAGDTVWGQAQARFGTAAEGFNHRKQHVAEIKPTVLIVGYGANEAFDGEEGLPKFLDGLNKMLDSLAENKARIVLLSPLHQEDMGRPLPDPTEQNKNLGLYRDAMKKLAEKRKLSFVDLFDLLPGGGRVKLTDNGMHLTPHGYWLSAFALEDGLGLGRQVWAADINIPKREVTGVGCTPIWTPDEPLRFTVRADVLPLVPARDDAKAAMPHTVRVLHVHGLAKGKFTLTIDGKETVTGTAKEWADGMKVPAGPDNDRAEKLRAAIVEKNRLYFHRWRPQNETYLFGFRKGEQGQNAPEIPKFDPLVAKQEEEIAKLRVPVAHTYELKPQRAEGDKS